MSAHHDLVDHLDHLADVVVAGTEPVPFDPHGLRRRRPTRHPRRWIVAIAVAGVAAAAAVWWAPSHDRSTDQVDTIDESTVVIDEPFPRLVPTVWPEGLDGDVTVEDPSGERPAEEVARHLLTRDGMAVAVASVTDFPLDGASPADGTSFEFGVVAGRDARWTVASEFLTLSVALEPGRTLSVSTSASGATRDELAALAAAYDAQQLDFDGAAMPRGWSTDPDAERISTFLGGSGLDPGWPSVMRTSASVPNTMVRVAGLRAVEPNGTLEQIGALTGGAAEPVRVRSTNGLLLSWSIPVASHLVVWQFSDDVIAVVWAIGVDPSQTLAVAASLEEVDSASWAALRPPPPEPPRIANGFELHSSDEVVLDTGEAFGHRWMFTSGSGRELPVSSDGVDAEPHPRMVSLYVMGPDGRQLGGSSWGGSGLGFGGGVVGRYQYFVAGLPPGVTDVSIALHGEAQEVVEADLGDGERMVFTMVESRTIPNVGRGDVAITGVNPDGTEYRAVI